jgi:hypothetical protein
MLIMKSRSETGPDVGLHHMINRSRDHITVLQINADYNIQVFPANIES